MVLLFKGTNVFSSTSNFHNASSLRAKELLLERLRRYSRDLVRFRVTAFRTSAPTSDIGNFSIVQLALELSEYRIEYWNPAFVINVQSRNNPVMVQVHNETSYQLWHVPIYPLHIGSLVYRSTETLCQKLKLWSGRSWIKTNVSTTFCPICILPSIQTVLKQSFAVIFF